MRDLQQISVIGAGLLGASVSLAVSRSISSVRTVVYSHRAQTREKARQMGIADEIADDQAQCVENADLVILATPISIFSRIFDQISSHLKANCIVTDVGSTKTGPHLWAEEYLRKDVFYVGSHPIAGSEKRGVDFARDDLFFGARCIITKVKGTDSSSIETVSNFWQSLGSRIDVMSPKMHDQLFANVSHVPHAVAAALINATKWNDMKYAGKGFIDTSRVASGPSNIWMDIFLSNAENISGGLSAVIEELSKLKDSMDSKDSDKIKNLLEKARQKRSKLIEHKIKNKELI